MMKKTLLLVATLALALISCKQNDAAGPMFWTWLEEVPEEGAEAVFARMEEAGLDAVMINVVSEENLRQGIELARKHHLAVYAWIKVLNLPKPEREFLLANHPDWFSVNRNGESLKDTKAYKVSTWITAAMWTGFFPYPSLISTISRKTARWTRTSISATTR